MKVLLKTDVENLGEAGDIKDVAGGYARNFLIPRGLAIAASKGAVKQAKQIKDTTSRRRDRQRRSATSFAKKLEALTLTFKARAADTDRLFGSVTSADIALAIEQATGESMDKRHIMLERPIRQLGAHQVPVRLMAEVVPEVTVIVEREGEPVATIGVQAEPEEAEYPGADEAEE